MSSTSLQTRTIADLGMRISEIRKTAKIKAVDVAARTGRSRNTLHRLESGEDVSLGTFLDILKAVGYRIELVPNRMPTLEEMKARFQQDGDE